MRLVWGTVGTAREPEAGAQRLFVVLDDASESARAVAYTALTGPCAVGERVLCNTTAVDLSLGTGGEHFVVARAGEGVSFSDPVPGHIMKLRYTPLQRDVTVVEEPASAHHAVMADARNLDGMPVICCGLHSQVPVAAAAAKDSDASLRIAYVMTDEASLPLAVSRLVPLMLEVGLLASTITCGQAFGGQFEAVNLYSALLAARHVVKADMAIVSIGPGIPGTATPFGHSGIAQGQAVNAAASLGGVPVAALRVSFADERPRHRPVSHQTLTALSVVTLASALVPVPVLSEGQDGPLLEALERSGIWRLHEQRHVRATLPDMRGLDVRSMGRSFAEDPAFFLAAAAAGVVAASEVSGTP